MGIGFILSLGWRLLRGVSASAVGDTADRLLGRLTALQDAKSEVERAEIEREIAQLKMIHDLQKPQSARWWSPMQIVQYLIGGSFGIWFAAVCFVSIYRPFFVEGVWEVDDLPPRLWDMANWLIPIIIGGAILNRRK